MDPVVVYVPRCVQNGSDSPDYKQMYNKILKSNHIANAPTSVEVKKIWIYTSTTP
jgi:hypothetical protein